MDATLEALERFRHQKVAPLEKELQARVGPAHLDDRGLLRREIVDARAQVRRWAAEEGFYNLHLPRSIGGAGFTLEEMFFVEEAAYRHGLGLFKDCLAWTEGPSPALLAADDEQKQTFVEPLLSGEATTCFAITEPGAGSDFLAMTTTARHDGGDWVLNGRKALITWAPFADVAVIIARTAQSREADSLSAFFVPNDTPGYSADRVNRTMMDDGVTGEIALSDCRIPRDFLLGEVGQGFHLAMAFVNWRRVCRAGMCAGLARYLFDKTLARAKQRATFGRPLGARQFIQFVVADMYVRLRAMRSLSLDLLKRLDELDIWRLAKLPTEAVRLISALKVWNDEALYEVADKAVQTHGGWGLVSETGIEQIFRVARNLRIPAGTDEIQRLAIARTFGLHENMELPSPRSSAPAPQSIPEARQD